jgi:hypothetical protein
VKAGRLILDLARDRHHPTDAAAHRKAAQQAHEETRAKFYPLTHENAQEAVEWQEQRIRELLASGGAR